MENLKPDPNNQMPSGKLNQHLNWADDASISISRKSLKCDKIF